tara:strand:+ start:360 stop:770 length:411 start_codon:yes stop_codon:yes gene_type:complete
MKWQVTDKKYNPATGKTQEYNIAIDTTEKDNMVEVRVTVPPCPRGQRPVTWHATNVLSWLKEKGLNVVDTLQTETLTDATAKTGTYSFSLRQKQNKVRHAKTNKTRKNIVRPPTKPADKLSVTNHIVTSNSTTETE